MTSLYLVGGISRVLRAERLGKEINFQGGFLLPVSVEL